MTMTIDCYNCVLISILFTTVALADYITNYADYCYCELVNKDSISVCARLGRFCNRHDTKLYAHLICLFFPITFPIIGIIDAFLICVVIPLKWFLKFLNMIRKEFLKEILKQREKKQKESDNIEKKYLWLTSSKTA